MLRHACTCKASQAFVPKCFDTLMICRASRSFAKTGLSWGLLDAPRCSKITQNATKMLPRFSKMLQDAPKMLQDAPRSLQDTPRCSQHTPMILPRYSQDAPKILLRCSQDTPKMLQDAPKMLPRSSQDAPKMIPDAPTSSQVFPKPSQVPLPRHLSSDASSHMAFLRCPLKCSSQMSPPDRIFMDFHGFSWIFMDFLFTKHHPKSNNTIF